MFWEGPEYVQQALQIAFLMFSSRLQGAQFAVYSFPQMRQPPLKAKI